MSFKIGFTFEDKKADSTVNKIAAMENSEESLVARKSVVDVFFAKRHLTCSYYNDMFDLKVGDCVYVDGKLAGMLGRVVAVGHNFKIKLSDYKRVIGVVNTNVSGEFNFAGSHLITTDRYALNYERAITWFKAPESGEEETVSSFDDKVFNINNLSEMGIDEEVAEGGAEYYEENCVEYIELNAGHGRAVVTGSRAYEIEFEFSNGDISGLVCECYRAEVCKHEFAVMLQLRETLKIIEEEYPDVDTDGYLAIISKRRFFEFVLNSKKNGGFCLS